MIYQSADSADRRVGIFIEKSLSWLPGFWLVMIRETFFRARNGYRETSADLTVERAFVAAADFPERLFENQFAYCDTENGRRAS